jgi:hypothetical protein
LIFEVRGVGDGAMWVDKAIFTWGCDISIGREGLGGWVRILISGC